MTTYIYGLVDPRDGHIRYVGKSDDPEKRLTLHLIERRKSHKFNWIRLLKNMGLTPALIILAKVAKSGWQSSERFQIAFFRNRGMADLNATDGGDGCPGCHPSEETIQKIKMSNTGWKHTDEARAKIKERRKHQIVKHSEETRRKIGDANRRRLGMKFKPRLPDAPPHRGHKHSEETRLKMSETAKRLDQAKYFRGKRWRKLS